MNSKRYCASGLVFNFKINTNGTLTLFLLVLYRCSPGVVGDERRFYDLTIEDVPRVYVHFYRRICRKYRAHVLIRTAFPAPLRMMELIIGGVEVSEGGGRNSDEIDGWYTCMRNCEFLVIGNLILLICGSDFKLIILLWL